jgi:hypothetical protein
VVGSSFGWGATIARCRGFVSDELDAPVWAGTIVVTVVTGLLLLAVRAKAVWAKNGDLTGDRYG